MLSYIQNNIHSTQKVDGRRCIVLRARLGRRKCGTRHSLLDALVSSSACLRNVHLRPAVPSSLKGTYATPQTNAPNAEWLKPKIVHMKPAIKTTTRSENQIFSICCGQELRAKDL